MPDMTFTIMGTPIGFDCIPDNRNQYFMQYYDGSTTLEKFVIDRHKTSVDYVYLRYGLLSSEGRSGSFIGLAISLEGAYCSEPLKIATLLKSIYSNLIKTGVLIQSTSNTGQNIVQYSKMYGVFKKLSSYVHQMTAWLEKTLEEDFRGVILPLGNLFQGQENLNLMQVLPWNSEITAEEILSSMHKYSFLSFIPDTKITTAPVPVVSSEEIAWLRNYGDEGKDFSRKKELDSLYASKNEVESTQNKFSLLKETYERKELIDELNGILYKTEELSQSISHFFSVLEIDRQKIITLKDVLTKSTGGENDFVKRAFSANESYKKEGEKLANFAGERMDTTRKLLEHFRRPIPHSDRKDFLGKAWTWMISYKKGVAYILFVLLFAGVGLYTYHQFFSSKEDMIVDAFSHKKASIEELIRNGMFFEAKDSLDNLQRDTTYKNLFKGEIDTLYSDFYARAIAFFDEEMVGENLVEKANSREQTFEDYCAETKTEIDTLVIKLGPKMQSLAGMLQARVDDYYMARVWEVANSSKTADENKKKDIAQIIKNAVKAGISEKAREKCGAVRDSISNAIAAKAQEKKRKTPKVGNSERGKKSSNSPRRRKI